MRESSLLRTSVEQRHTQWLQEWILRAGFGTPCVSPAAMLVRPFSSTSVRSLTFPSIRRSIRMNQHQSLRMASTLPRLPIFEAIATHDPDSTAVIHSTSKRRFTYGQLLKDVADARDKLLQSASGQSTDGQRVAFLVENSYDYVGATEIHA